MDRQRPGKKVMFLSVLVALGIAYGSLLYFQSTLTGTNNLDGIIGVVLGLYICSHPTAKRIKIYDMMAVGYPAYSLGIRSPRNIEEMIHYDQYDRSRLRSDQQIKDFIKHLRKRDREEMEGLMRGMKARQGQE